MDWKLHRADNYEQLLNQMLKSMRLMGPPNPLLETDFVVPAVKHFGSSRTRILTGYESGQPILILPVEKFQFGIWRSFAPSQLPIAPIHHAKSIETMPDPVKGHSAAHSIALFFDLMHFDAAYNPPVDERGNLVAFTKYCTTMAIDTCVPFEDYWQQRKKKLRDNMKRYRKRTLRQVRDVHFRQFTDPDDIRIALKRYADIESSGWKGQIGTAIETHNQQGRFYDDVLTRFARRGMARIFELKFDDEVVSSRIGIQSDDVIVFLKTTYDERFSKLSPGRQLLIETLQMLFADDSISRLEFYTNANADQAQWGSELREIQHVTFFQSALARLLLDGYKKVRAVLSTIGRGGRSQQ